MEEQLQALTAKIEAQQILMNKEFKSYFNQPDMFSITSRNATFDSVLNSPTLNNSFYRYTIDLPKNILKAKSIQLAGINFPTATGTSFHDSELVFYYHRLKTSKSANISTNITVYQEIPNETNLYMVRLLPSYYKQELIPDAQLFGFNKTFNNYEELSDELAKACANDLAVRNGSSAMPFIANDITISYNESQNKFQMSGNNVNTAWVPNNWSDSVNYEINQIVNVGGTYYIAIQANINSSPSSNPLKWDLYTRELTHSYLIAGFNNPFIPTVSAVVTDESSTFDFFYGQYITEGIYAIDLLGIPPQPLTQNGLTLNRRLGYNWNNEYTEFPNEVYYAFGYNQSYFPLLYNRIRPIPVYELVPPEFELTTIPFPNNNPFTQSVYVFDGYCNLVYSSILYIYSDIGFSSSLSSDTTDVTLSLLGTIPLICGQLGIAYHHSFLENPLKKINESIERIAIELRDERNLPYYIGNNSIVNLSFKVEY
jgi:hypothetical protein